MNLSDDTNWLPVVEDFPCAARMESSVGARIDARELGLPDIGRWHREAVPHRGERRLEGAQFRSRRLGSAGRNVGGQRQQLRLLDRVRLRFPEHRAELEEARPALVLPSVEAERLQETG